MASSENNEDLSLISNDRFKIVFDIYTPRPHFIILYQHGSNKNRVIDLNEEDLNKMFELIDLFIETFKLANQNMILSFHTGRWATNRDVFHAHISVALDVYLTIYNEHSMSDLEGYRKGAIFNRGWIIKPTNGIPMRTTYIENVRNYMISNAKASNKYRLDEIQKIGNLRRTNDEGRNLSATIDCQIEFDHHEPKIRFRYTSMPVSFESRLKLLKEMCRITNENGLFGDSNGSHICLNLNPHDILNGYIHTSGDYFYQIHPDRNRFLENYRNQNSYFIGT